MTPPPPFLSRAQIRLIPRLKIYLQREDNEYGKVRPPARLFNPEEVSRLTGEEVMSTRSVNSGEGYVYDGMTFEDGCLIKTIAVRGLRWENVTPSL
eukprot:5402936-Pleurochrysis_carterae.AAC.1